jgi:tripartite-type tricarboxylate transporter receptor subunit TctC
VTSLDKSPVIPDLPPIAKMGVPGYHFELWWGMLAPPKMAPELADRINADVNAIIRTQEMKDIFLREGAEPAPISTREFAKTIRDEIEGWKKVAKQADIKPE